jgi:DNA-directed RNA polymerase III subunit RPC4
MDQPNKAAVVLGEVHKNYLVTPDIDRLLEELYINGGKTPGDREREEKNKDFGIAKVKGLQRISD